MGNVTAGASNPLIVTGMAMEAALLGGASEDVIIGAGDAAGLARQIEAALALRARPVLSFGVAGGLAPGLAPGALVIADAVWAAGERIACDPEWVNRLRLAITGTATVPVAGWARRTLQDGAMSSGGASDRDGRGPGIDIAAQDAPVATAAAKAALHQATGALAADMESHVVAQLAQRHNLPFAALRAIADPAGRNLPPAALVPLQANGKPDMPAILAALARRPGQISALLTLSRDLKAAMRVLREAAQRDDLA